MLLTDGSTARRHVDNIKARYDNTTSKEDNADYSALQPTSNETAMEDIAHPDTVMPVATSATDDTTVPELVVATRPTRVRRPPKQFDLQSNLTILLPLEKLRSDLKGEEM